MRSVSILTLLIACLTGCQKISRTERERAVTVSFNLAISREAITLPQENYPNEHNCIDYFRLEILGMQRRMAVGFLNLLLF
jgi:hypothetical protein